jgi:hypothetical protein
MSDAQIREALVRHKGDPVMAAGWLTDFFWPRQDVEQERPQQQYQPLDDDSLKALKDRHQEYETQIYRRQQADQTEQNNKRAERLRPEMVERRDDLRRKAEEFLASPAFAVFENDYADVTTWAVMNNGGLYTSRVDWFQNLLFEYQDYLLGDDFTTIVPRGLLPTDFGSFAGQKDIAHALAVLEYRDEFNELLQ